MFTQCPECRQTQTLTIDQLRATRGMIRCAHCSTQFDALQSLSDTPVAIQADHEAEHLPWTHKPKSTNQLFWNLSAVAGIFLLIGQIIYFMGPAALQNEKLRPWIEHSCSYLKCTLPDYKKLSDFSVLASSLVLTADQNYYFSASINNQADFAQAHPGIKLTLLKLSGEPFAQRSFSSDELTYRSNKIAPNETIDIGLTLAAPSIPLGGYTFELN